MHQRVTGGLYCNAKLRENLPAGKDLFDASFLLRDHTTLDDVLEVAPRDMWPKIAECLRGIPLPIRVFAEDMAKRARVGDVPVLG